MKLEKLAMDTNLKILKYTSTICVKQILSSENKEPQDFLENLMHKENTPCQKGGIKQKLLIY